MTDTSGLRAFYNANKDSFVWEDRIEMYTINAASTELIDQAYELVKKGLSKDSIMKILNASNPLNIFIERGLYEQGMNKEADNIIIKKDQWNASNPYLVSKGLTNGVYRAYIGLRIIEREQKPFNDARGELSAMYQKKVEDEWLESLRKKYKIKVNKKGYNSFKTQMLAL